MEEFEGLKMEIRENRKALEEATAHIAVLNRKLDETVEKLAGTGRQLREAFSSLETALTQHATREDREKEEKTSNAMSEAIERLRTGRLFRAGVSFEGRENNDERI